MNSNACHELNFHRRDLKFSDIVSNTITIMNKKENKYAKIDKISWPYPAEVALIYYARGAQGVLPMRVGVRQVNLMIPSLRPFSVAGCG